MNKDTSLIALFLMNLCILMCAKNDSKSNVQIMIYFFFICFVRKEPINQIYFLLN